MITNICNQFILEGGIEKDPILKLDKIIKSSYTGNNIIGPVEVPIGNLPYQVLSWKIENEIEFRLLVNNSGHNFSVRFSDGIFWVVSESTDTLDVNLKLSDFDDFNYYSKNLGNPVEQHIFKAFSEGSDSIYNVNLKEATCSCANFKYKCSHFTPDKSERYCKHMNSILMTYPEYLPQSLKDAETHDINESKVEGKQTYPRSIFDLYIMDLKSGLSQFKDSISNYLICGDYRRLKENISELDIIYSTVNDIDNNDFIEYFKSMYGYEVTQVGNRYLCIVDGYVKINFYYVRNDEFNVASIHYTGSKSEIMSLKSRAAGLGYTLTDRALIDNNSGNNVVIDSEESLYSRLQLPYKQPWER